MATAIHKDQAVSDGIHTIVAFEAADAAARAALVLVAADEGKIVRQTDNDSFWVITGTGPNTFTDITAAGGGGGGTDVEVEDEGVSLTTAATKLNFVGAGVTATEPVADEITVTIPGNPLEVEDEGVSLSTAVTKIDFAGTGVTATEPVAGEILVTIPGAGGGSFLYADKASDTARSSTTTLADDPDLTITVVANTKYRVSGTLFVTNADTLAGFKLAFVTPSGTLRIAQNARRDNTTTTSTAHVHTTSGSGKGVSNAAAEMFLHFDGIVDVAGTGGAFKIQWAQFLSSASATTLLAKSYMRLEETP